MSRNALLFSLLAAFTLACNSNSDGTRVAPLTAEEASAAQYLMSSRLDNGAYDWSLEPTAELDKSRSGYQNVTGVSALGLLDALDRDRDSLLPNVPRELALVKDYLLKQMQAHLDDENSNVSPPNFLFLARYRAQLGLGAEEWQTVLDCWEKRLDALDAEYGSDAGVRVDGLVNEIRARRANQNIAGLAGWDMAFVLRTLVAMDAPRQEIEWMASELEAMPLDPAETYGLLSAAHALYALEMVGANARSEELVSKLLAELDEQGQVGGDVQTSAYALLGLRSLDLPESGLVDAYLRSVIDEDGRVLESNGLIYFAVISDVLSALLQ